MLYIYESMIIIRIVPKFQKREQEINLILKGSQKSCLSPEYIFNRTYRLKSSYRYVMLAN